ncbi:MAG: L,D-transpeptidase family protein [Parcubacteria group bacterium]|nr:L,D-transpeptidase family protein [Parcubacteria group bacterium]
MLNYKLLPVLIIAALVVAVGVFITTSEVSASEGRAPEVKIYNTDNKHLDKTFLAYDAGFRGGGNVAIGDFDGDGTEEILVGAGRGGGPHVKIFNQLGQPTGFDFFPFHPDFRGGVDVAAGDVNDDGKDEVIVSQASDGQAWVKVYKADAARTIIGEFLAYDPGFRGGVHVAAGDINGDGWDDIITGTGIDSTAHIRSFNAVGGFTGISLFPFESDFKGGVDVAVGNVDGGDEAEIIVSKNTFGTGQVKVYKSDISKRVLGDFLAFPDGHREGANVTAGDIDRDGEDEIIVGSNGNGPHIRTFEAHGYPKTLEIVPYEQDFRGGVKVAIGNIDNSSATEIVAIPSRRVWEGRKGIYKYIEVDISEQKLVAYKGGRKKNEFAVSTGVAKYSTPVGDFSVRTKLIRDDMEWDYGPDHPDNYDIKDVPHTMYFNGGYALHGAYWHNNFGHVMSHGCVNISLPNAAWLYNWANVGDAVYVRQ